MSNNMDKHKQFLFSSLTDISQIARYGEEAQPKEVTMAKSKKSENSINIKYSSVTGELVIDGQSMGMFVDANGKHPSKEEMDTFIRLMQQELPFESKIVDNLKSKPKRGAKND